MSFRLYGDPGESGEVIIPPGKGGLTVTLDGKRVRPVERDNESLVSYLIPGQVEPGPGWTVPEVRMTGRGLGEPSAQITFALKVNIPPRIESPRLVLLAEGDVDTTGLDLRAHLNGNRVKLELVPGGTTQFAEYVSLLLEYRKQLVGGPVLELDGPGLEESSGLPMLPDFTPEEFRLDTIVDRLPVET